MHEVALCCGAATAIAPSIGKSQPDQGRAGKQCEDIRLSAYIQFEEHQPSTNGMAATKVHWRAPAMMAGSLLAAIAFAVGHHLFYSNLAGQVVPIGNYTIAGFTVSVQQANIASGTALAFLVKACLVLAIGTAYTQVFWQSVSGRSTTVSMLDRLAAALQNFLLLLHWMVWWKYPLLLLVALIAWCAWTTMEGRLKGLADRNLQATTVGICHLASDSQRSDIGGASSTLRNASCTST